jgi:hypothetical protein
MVAEHVVVALGNLHGLVALAVVELRAHVALFDAPSVHEQRAPPQLDGVAGHAHHALDEGDGRVLRVPEHHDVAAVDGLEAVHELVDDDALAVLEQGQHARPLDAEGLGHERDQEEAEENGHGQVVDQLPHRAPDLRTGAFLGGGEGEAGLAGDGGLDPRGVQVQPLSRRTTRVPARRS